MKTSCIADNIGFTEEFENVNHVQTAIEYGVQMVLELQVLEKLEIFFKKTETIFGP